jgi:MoxR-like ATPase
MNVDLEEFKGLSRRILDTAGGVFVGEELILRKLLSAALANGHVLFEDNPGLGKTLLAKVFAKATGCQWGRVQFTPDLMPADILGTRVWKSRDSEFVLEKGPIFTNILLADEINRSPPKTQAALLEAMEERQVTIEGTTHRLDPPFFVIATQNPIEHEGTFPLPEAQLDRFIMRLTTGYVKSLDLESEILRRRIRWRSDDPVGMVKAAVDRELMVEMQRMVENDIYVDDSILDYVSRIVRQTREHRAVEIGASPRGGIALLKLSRSHAAISGRNFVTPDDIKMFATDALTHRVILKMEYELDTDITSTAVIQEIVSKVEAPKDYMRKSQST